MQKSVISLIITLSTAHILFAETGTTDAATAPTEATTTQVNNTAKGFYLGAGLGTSFYNASLTKSQYYIQDPDGTYVIKGDDLSELDDSDTGYILYGGYQFNKIVGIEGSFTDYGTFSSDLKNRTYTKQPQSYAIAANVGYNFLNGQLRPFGIIGLGYLITNQDCDYKRLDIWKEDFVTLHMGVGVEYYPTVLKGLGFRASYVADSYVGEVDTFEGPSTTDKVTHTLLWQNYSLLYAAIAYKF